MKVPNWVLDALGKRVVLVAPMPGLPRGRTGILVSIQSGHEPGATKPYATVCFDLLDWSDEQNVPFPALRPVGGIG